nr:phosphatidylserine decarboxylase proenzyme 2-like isoform X1 [Tanacetum cinerariifolium]
MGHGSSKSMSYDDLGGSNGKHMSRRERFKKKLHLHMHRGDKSSRGNLGSSHPKLSSLDDFAGIALVTIISAEMKFKDKWLACMSIGEQT